MTLEQAIKEAHELANETKQRVLVVCEGRDYWTLVAREAHWFMGPNTQIARRVEPARVTY